ncbi:TPA: hypothetical protein ACGPBE_000201 [Streptococcus suis]
MCVQGYYTSKEGNKTMPVQVESRLDNEHIEVLVGIGEEVSSEKQEKILAYVEQKCKVKALLKESIIFEAKFYVLESVE